MPDPVFAYDLSTLNGVTFHYGNLSYGDGEFGGYNDRGDKADPRLGIEINVADSNFAANSISVEYINALAIGQRGGVSAIVTGVDQTYTAGFDQNGFHYLPTFGTVTLDITTDAHRLVPTSDGNGSMFTPFHYLKTFYIHGFGDDHGSLLISDGAALGFEVHTLTTSPRTWADATPAIDASGYGKSFFGILSSSDLGAGPTSPGVGAGNVFTDANNITHGPYYDDPSNISSERVAFDNNPAPPTLPLHFGIDGSGYVAAPAQEAPKGFDLTKLNGIVFEAGALTGVTNPGLDANYTLNSANPNAVTIRYLDAASSGPTTVSHAVNYYHAGGMTQQGHYYLPTFGSIQISIDGNLDTSTLWVHGFSDGALLLSSNKFLTIEHDTSSNITSSSIFDHDFQVLNNSDTRPGSSSPVFPTYAPRTGVSDFSGMYHTNLYAHGEFTDANGALHTLTLYDANGDGIIANPTNQSTEIYGTVARYYPGSSDYGTYQYFYGTYRTNAFNLNNTAAPLTFPLTFTGAGENYVAPVCFAEGTRIETVAGPVAVEALAEGDLVVTAEGAPRAVTWIGRMVARPSRHPHPHEVNPVRVRAHAFGPGRPERDVRLSPGHAVHVDGVLVPIGHLVNGATIVQEAVEAIRYFHVELDSHDVLIAEGLPCESYLDDGNRDVFANAEGHAALHGRLDPQSWEHACAPLVADGPQLTALQQRLQHAAEALGWVRSEASGLRIVVDGVDVAPVRIAGNRMWFALPVTPDTVTLASNHSVLAQMMPGLPDFRRLGVAIAELRVDGVAIELADAAFGAGFYPVEHHEQHAWRWTDGAASLALPVAADGATAGAMIELAVIMVAPSWVRPASTRRETLAA